MAAVHKEPLTDSIRVYLLDDHDVVREGLRFLLERTEDIEVVDESGTAAEATTCDSCVATGRGRPGRPAPGRVGDRGGWWT